MGIWKNLKIFLYADTLKIMTGVNYNIKFQNMILKNFEVRFICLVLQCIKYGPILFNLCHKNLCENFHHFIFFKYYVMISSQCKKNYHSSQWTSRSWVDLTSWCDCHLAYLYNFINLFPLVMQFSIHSYFGFMNL